MNNKFIGIIPARFGSQRFPGKPLALLGDKTIVEHVYRRASDVLTDVFVATDDIRIYETVVGFGGKAVMTSPAHPSGTDRVYEAFSKIDSDADVIINIQGDEPFIAADQLNQLMAAFDKPETDIATLAREFNPAQGIEALRDPNKVKVTFSNEGFALYFSRSQIPFVRGVDTSEILQKITFYTHVGIYAYRSEVLKAITKLEPSSLENSEKLEQLRWLQNGYRIHVGITDIETIGIDTPQDLEKARIELSELTNRASARKPKAFSERRAALGSLRRESHARVAMPTAKSQGNSQ